MFWATSEYPNLRILPFLIDFSFFDKLANVDYLVNTVDYLVNPFDVLVNLKFSFNVNQFQTLTIWSIPLTIWSISNLLLLCLDNKEKYFA